jgi:hypothetical protein
MGLTPNPYIIIDNLKESKMVVKNLTQLEQKLKEFIEIDKLSPQELLLKKMRFVGEKQLRTIVEKNLEINILHQEYVKGNKNFEDDLPYPDSYWEDLAGFEQYGLGYRPCASDFRALLRHRDISVYTIDEAVGILKLITQHIIIERMVQNEL